MWTVHTQIKGVATVRNPVPQAETDRAALVALKVDNCVEKQEQQLRRKREQLDLEAELNPSTPKLADLPTLNTQRNDWSLTPNQPWCETAAKQLLSLFYPCVNV